MKMRINKTRQSKPSSYKFGPVKLDLVQQYNLGLPARFFSSTTPRRADPLGFVVAAFSSPYTASMLNNPLAGMFITLVGMGTALFGLTMSLPAAFTQDFLFLHLLQQLDGILLLCERFLSSEQHAIDLLLANIDNFTPEILQGFYLLLQELVAVRESLYSNIDVLITSTEIELLPGPVVDRINQNFENLRTSGNDLMILIRNLEYRLMIPAQRRIPAF